MIKLLGFLTLLSSYNAIANPVMDGQYGIKCVSSIADGGSLIMDGKLEVVNGIASGHLNTELRVDSDDIDAPEAEAHFYPSLEVSGQMLMAASAIPDGRGTRSELRLRAKDPSVSRFITRIQLIDNRPQTPSSDPEQSELYFEGRRFSGACTFTEI